METVVLLLAMVPLLFAIPVVGKLVDLRQTTEQASRYATWESTVHDGADLVSSSARSQERFFGSPAAPIQSMDTEPGHNPLWGSTSSAILSAQSTYSDLRIDRTGTGVAHVQMNAVAQPESSSLAVTLGELGRPLSRVSGNNWDMHANGLARTDVFVAVHGNSWLPEGHCQIVERGACFSQSAVILTDGWGVSSAEQAKARVRSLVPASVADPIGNVLSLMGAIPVFDELKPLDRAFGHVDMSVLPRYEEGGQ